MAASGTTPTEQYEFISESLSKDQEIIRTEGIRGTRFHPQERIRRGRQMISGDIVMEPTYGELRNLLPRIIGAETGTGPYTYTVSNTQTSAYSVMINRGNVTGKEWVYQNCRTSRSTWRGAPGQPIGLTLTVEALTETQQTISTWSGVAISATPPFVWHDGVLTIGGSTYPVIEWESTIDWVLKTDRFVNSQTRTDLPSTDCVITTRFTVPFNTTSDNTAALYDDGGDVTGQAANINFTWNPGTTNVNLQFNYANVVFAAKKSPSVSSKDEIVLVLEAEARMTGSTVPLNVVLDPTN